MVHILSPSLIFVVMQEVPKPDKRDLLSKAQHTKPLTMMCISAQQYVITLREGIQRLLDIALQSERERAR